MAHAVAVRIEGSVAPIYTTPVGEQPSFSAQYQVFIGGQGVAGGADQTSIDIRVPFGATEDDITAAVVAEVRRQCNEIGYGEPESILLTGFRAAPVPTTNTGTPA